MVGVVVSASSGSSTTSTRSLSCFSGSGCFRGAMEGPTLRRPMLMIMWTAGSASLMAMMGEDVSECNGPVTSINESGGKGDK